MSASRNTRRSSRPSEASRSRRRPPRRHVYYRGDLAGELGGEHERQLIPGQRTSLLGRGGERRSRAASPPDRTAAVAGDSRLATGLACWRRRGRRWRVILAPYKRTGIFRSPNFTQ